VTVLTPARVVRRSALEAGHTALGARWLADDVRWPIGYGASRASGAVEAGAVACGAGLAEIGPLDEWLLRGPGAVAAADAIAIGESPLFVGRALVADVDGETIALWLLGPDEVLLLAPLGGTALARLVTRFATDDVSVIEMTGARTSLRLAGPAAPAILAELCPVDTTPTSMAPGDLVQAPLAGVRAFIAREDTAVTAHPSHPGYTIMIARDEAAYVWDAIREIGTAQGLVPVGPAAVGAQAQPQAEAAR
jgi:4-methylaminobutanoate oxidase (formaldehyde-forming)